MSVIQLPAKYGGHPYLLTVDGRNVHLTRMSKTGRRNVVPINRDDAAELTNLIHDLIEQDNQA